MTAAGLEVGGLLLKRDLWSGILAGVGPVLGLGVIKLILIWFGAYVYQMRI